MLWLNFKRILKTGFTNFWRNTVVSLSSVLVMMITLLIISGVFFSDALLKHTLISLEQKIDINISLLPEVTDENINKIKTDLESLPQVEYVELLSPEQVLEQYKENNKSEQVALSALELLNDNPFGASLKVKAIGLDQYESIYNFLSVNYAIGESNSLIDDVNFVKKELVIKRLEKIITAGERFGLAITIIFIILSIIITLNTIRLAMYISKDEVKVMNLVGADRHYIKGPFVVTGAVYGLFSAIFVSGILYPITYYLGEITAETFFGLNIFTYYLSNFGTLFLILLCSGIFIGGVSSSLAIKKYLNV